MISDKKICFVVPTYPPHYLYARDFMKSFRQFEYDKQADLIFVFTTLEEKEGFLPCDSIVLPKSLRILKNKSIMILKKYYALMKLKDKYEYIIVLDDECIFTKNVNLMKICDDFFESKILYGNIVQNRAWDIMGTIVEDCKDFFDVSRREDLNCPLYLWFNQIPIYKCSTLSDFFKKTEIDKRLPKLTWNHFEYYIYMHYLMLYHGFQVEDIGIISNFAVTEIVSEDDYIVVNDAYKNQKIYMSTAFAQKTFGLRYVFIIIHQDRAIERKRRHIIKYIFNNIQMYFKVKKLIS